MHWFYGVEAQARFAEVGVASVTPVSHMASRRATAGAVECAIM